MAKIVINSYMKNVAKSFGYALGDNIKKYNPYITSLVKETKETTSEVYSSIKEFTMDKSATNSEKDLNKGINSVNDIFKNLKDDLKTGNFYNKERSEKLASDLASSVIGIDMDDFDMNFDDDDWGDFDDNFDDDVDSGTKAAISATQQSTAQIINAVDIVGSRVAGAVGEATLESANYIVKSNRIQNKAIYDLNKRGFSQVTESIFGLNKTIASFAQIGEPMNQYMQNSNLFFTNTSKSLSNIEQRLGEIAKNTTPPPSSTNRRYSSSNDKSLRSIISDGAIDINAYKEMIKSNFKDSKDIFNAATSFLDTMKSKGVTKNISIAQFATSWITDVVFPGALKESMKQFNESLKYSLSAQLLHTRNKAKNTTNPLLSFLADYIFPQEATKDKIDISNYEKGTVSWDGIARKALTDVIPELLSKIYSGIIGTREELVYDYNRGTFTTKSNVRNLLKKDKLDAAKSAGGEFRNDLIDLAKENKESERMQKEIDAYFLYAFTSGKLSEVNYSNFDLKKAGLSKDTLALIQEYIKSKKSGTKLNKAIVDMEMGKADFADKKKSEEYSGTSNERYVLDMDPDSSKMGLDTYNHSMGFYLQGIFQYSGYIADNIDYLAGRKKTKSKRRKLSDYDKDFFDSSTSKEEFTKSSKEENKPKEKSKAEKASEYVSNKFNNNEIRKISDDEYERYNKTTNKWEKIVDEDIKDIQKKYERQQKTKNIKDKVLKIPNAIKSLYSAPADAVAGLLNNITSSLNSVFWGDENKADRGIFGVFIDESKSAFSKFSNWLKDVFSEDRKDGIVNFFNKLFDGNFVEDVKENLRGAGRKVGNGFKDLFFGKKKNDETVADNGKAARGRKVTKTGIVAVSEGEMIVPSELNPFYHGRTNKRAQEKAESSVVKKFYGSFKDGNIDVGGETKDEEINSISDFFFTGLKKLVSGASAIKSAATGNKGEETDQDKKDKAIIKKISSKMLEEAGDNKGAIGAGALIGAGVSIATGAVVGPLFGAAIGGAVGLAVKSQTVQKLLFGETDEKGEYQGALLSKEMSNFFAKNVPSMAKGAGIGAVGGLFMGSPVLGAILGSTVGFISTSDRAKDWLFGDIGEDGKRVDNGVISQQTQKSIKGALPSISAGAIAGMVAGPFGLFGNLVFGAGLGYLSTSEDFRKYIFGDKETGKVGLIENLQNKVFTHLDDLFHNMSKALAGFSKKLFKNISNKVGKLIEGSRKAIKHKANDGTILGSILGFGGKVVDGTVGATGRLLSGLSRQRKAKNLKKGYGAYGTLTDENGDPILDKNGKPMKGDLNAAQRLALGNSVSHKYSNSAMGNFDKSLSKIDSKEQLAEVRSLMKDAGDPSRLVKRATNATMRSFYSKISDVSAASYKIADKVGKKFEKEGASANNASSLINTMTAFILSQPLNKISQENKDKLIAAVKQYAEQLIRDYDAEGKSKAAKSNLLSKFGINVDAKGFNMTGANDLLVSEQKLRFGELTEEDWRTKVLKVFESIGENVDKIANGNAKDDESKKESRRSKKRKRGKNQSEKKDNKSNDSSEQDLDEILSDDISSTEEEQLPSSKKGKFATLIAGIATTAIGMADKVKGAAKNAKQTVFDMFGNVHQYTTNNQGESVEDNSDADTKESRSAINSFKGNIASIGTLGTSISGFFGKIKDKFFGSGKDEEKKPGIFEKMLSMLNGEDGPLAWLTSLFSGGSIGGGLFKGVSLASFIPSLLTKISFFALLAGAITGKFDDIAAQLTGHAYGAQENRNIVYDKDTGETLTQNEDGTYVNDAGEIVTPQNVASRRGGANTLSEATKINIGRGLLTGRRSLLDVGLGKGDNTGKAIANVIGNIAEKGLADEVLEGFAKIGQSLSKVPCMKGLATKIDDIGLEVAERVGKSAASKSAESLAKTAAGAVIWIKVAFIIADFTSGYDDARSTLGIIDEPSLPQRIISGLLRTVKNFIPVVGSLIPDEILVDIFCKYIAPAFGIEPEELMAQRQKAQETVDAYNADHGTNYSVTDYNKSVLKDYTWTERYANAAKSTAQDFKNDLANAKQGIQDKGLVGWAKDGISGMFNDFSTQYKESGGGIAGIFSGMGATFKNLLPGVLGEIAQKNLEIKSLAFKGQIGDMWKVSLDDFSGGGEANEDGIVTAMPSLFSRIFGQLPLIVSKLMNTGPAIIIAGFKKIGEFLSPVFKGLDQIFGVTDIIELTKQGKFLDVVKYSTADKDDNLFVRYIKMIPVNLTKMIATPISAVIGTVKTVANAIGTVINGIKKTVSFVKEQFTYGEKTIKDPNANLSDFMNMDNLKVDEDSPVSGIAKVTAVSIRLLAFPKLIIQGIGKKLFNGVKNVAGKVKNSVTTLFRNEIEIKKKAFSGDLSGLWNYDMVEDPDNPVGGITKFANKLMQINNLPIATVMWAGKKLVDGVKDIAGKVKASVDGLGTTFTNVVKLSLAGDTEGFFGYQFDEEDPDNPVGGFAKFVGKTTQFVMAPITIVSWAGHKIINEVKGVFDYIGGNIDSLGTATEALKEFAKEGDISGVLQYEYESDENDPLNGFWGIAFKLSQGIQLISAVINKIIKPLKDTVESVVDGVKNVAETAGDIAGDAWDSVTGTISGAAEGAYNWAASGVRNLIGGGSGNKGTGAPEDGFVSQLDNKYKGMKMGKKTVEDIGCAPAVAAMVSNKYGKNLSMKDAVNATNSFSNNEGTRADYFGKVLSKYGIGTNYIKGGNVVNQVMDNLGSGQPVILLGKDASNKSKKRSPFGPNGHYVVATGLDKNGNIIVNDPELNSPVVYDKSILTKANIGISTNAGGSGNNYDTNYSKAVWYYFNNLKGFSPEATAGIMGNLYQESKINPNALQNNRGPAAGIAQWENYTDGTSRWAGLKKYANENGYNWNELAPQLDWIVRELQDPSSTFFQSNGETYKDFESFKSASDYHKAAKDFELAFERAGNPQMDNRYSAAEAYYNLYNGKSLGNIVESSGILKHDPNALRNVGSVTGAAGAVPSGMNYTDTGDVVSANGTTENTEEQPTDLLSIITTAFSKIGDLFKTGISNILTGDNGSSSYGTTEVSSYNGSNAVGGNAIQRAIVQKLLNIQGKNSYSMSGPRDPDKGSADCSSTVNWAYKKTLGVDIGNNTDAILRNDNTEIVDLANLSQETGGQNSVGPNFDKLMPGDLMLYSRPSSEYAMGRPYRVGHVEMYVGGGKRIGHGSGMGPKVTDATYDSRKYIMAKRLKNIGQMDGQDNDTYRTNMRDQYAAQYGGSSGLLLSSAPSRSLYGGGSGAGSIRNYNGTSSNSVGRKTTSMLNNVKTIVATNASAGTITPELATQLIDAIVKILNTIANNTSSIDQIYKVLSAYISGKPAEAAKAVQEATNEVKSRKPAEIDSNIVNLVGTLAQIARG